MGQRLFRRVKNFGAEPLFRRVKNFRAEPLLRRVKENVDAESKVRAELQLRTEVSVTDSNKL